MILWRATSCMVVKKKESEKHFTEKKYFRNKGAAIKYIIYHIADFNSDKTQEELERIYDIIRIDTEFILGYKRLFPEYDHKVTYIYPLTRSAMYQHEKNPQASVEA